MRPRELASQLINQQTLSSNHWIITTLWFLDGLISLFHSIFLLPMVPPNRMIIGLGVANVLLLLYFLNTKINSLKLSFMILLYSFLIAILHLHIGNIYLIQNQHFINGSGELIIISSVVFLAMLFLLMRMQKLLLLVILTLSIASSALVNPLYRGLDPITKSEITSEIIYIDKKMNSERRWIVYDRALLANYLPASGINSLNSVQTYPQIDLWKKIDPKKNYLSAYNRYAHINAIASLSDTAIKINSSQSDVINLTIHPCHPVLEDLNVDFLIFNREVDYPCLSKLRELNLPEFTVFIYQKNPFNI